MADQLGASVGTAAAGQVLTGYTFSNSTNQNVSGSMPNQGSPTLQPGASIAAGYYSGGSVAGYPHGSQVFTSNGIFTVPSNVTQITVQAVGGGGSGAVGVTTYQTDAVVTGGNSGSLVTVTISVTPGQTFLVSLGAGGVGTTSSFANNGNAGGSTTFGTTITAAGGSGGVYVSSGTNTNVPNANGSSTVPSGGSVVYSYGQSTSATGSQAQDPSGGAITIDGFGFGSGSAGIFATSGAPTSSSGANGMVYVTW